MLLKSQVNIPGVPNGFLHKVAKIQGKKASEGEFPDISEEDVARLLPVSRSIQDEVVIDEQKEAVRPPLSFDYSQIQIGQTIPGKGVYAGIWTPEYFNPISRNRHFHVFAMPEDLKDKNGKKITVNFNQAATEVSSIVAFGHTAKLYADVRPLYYDLSRYRDIGRWFLPPADVFELLRAVKNCGDFRGTFADRNRDKTLRQYWALINRDVSRGEYIEVVDMDGDKNHGQQNFCSKSFEMNFVRAVRVEPVLER